MKRDMGEGEEVVVIEGVGGCDGMQGGEERDRGGGGGMDEGCGVGGWATTGVCRLAVDGARGVGVGDKAGGESTVRAAYGWGQRIGGQRNVGLAEGRTAGAS